MQITIPEGLRFRGRKTAVAVLEDFDPEEYQVLLGRDFLANFRFTYDGRRGTFELSR